MITLKDIQNSKILLLSEEPSGWNDFDKSLQVQGFQPLEIFKDIKALRDSVNICEADLIIFDLDRVQLDKKSILEWIANQVKNSNCPIIATVSKPWEEKLNEYFEAGVKWFLEKPLNFVYIFPKIKVLLENKILHANLANILENNSNSNEISEIINVISHDLREPLRKVKKLSDLMVSKFQSDLPDLGKEYLDRIQKTVERMDQLIFSITNFRNLTHKKSFYEELNLNCLVEEVLQDLEVLVDETGAIISVEKLPTIYGMPSQMRQLFQNLIKNGIIYHKEGETPEIKIDSHINQKDRVGFRVKDNGVGIDKPNLKSIFLPFERLKDKENIKGEGLGLAICRQIVDIHDGEIYANSEKGKGTTFIISLPQTFKK